MPVSMCPHAPPQSRAQPWGREGGWQCHLNPAEGRGSSTGTLGRTCVGHSPGVSLCAWPACLAAGLAEGRGSGFLEAARL